MFGQSFVKTPSPTPTDVQIRPGCLRPEQVAVRGYKHAMVLLIAATIAVNRTVEIRNCPLIEETRVLSEIFEQCGGLVSYENETLRLNPRAFQHGTVPDQLAERIHGSIYLLPVLLGRFGSVMLPETGGCRLSSAEHNGRPVHHMLTVLEAFGAEFTAQDGWIVGTSQGFHAIDIDIQQFSTRDDVLTGHFVSGATKTAILAALFVEHGETIIRNPYPKPDVQELLLFVEEAGYRVQRGPQEIRISRASVELSEQQVLNHDLMSCISTVMTYIALAVHARVPLQLTGLTVERVRAGLAEELRLLSKMGVPLEWVEDSLHILRAPSITNIDIDVTSVGIYSDHQPFFALMFLQGDRPARIREFVWPERFEYARELRKLGAQITFEDGAIVVHPSSLDRAGQTLVATDLRAAAALLLAAVGVNGRTEIKNIHHIERGYDDLLDTLSRIGVDVETLAVEIVAGDC